MWRLALGLFIGDSSTYRLAVAPAESLQVTLGGAALGAPVVLVPGLFGSAYGFRHLIHILTASGYRAIVVEPLGIGASGRPAHADYSLTAQAQEVLPAGATGIPRAAVAAAMREECGYDRRATTNQSRLQTRVLLRLAHAAHVAAPAGAVLFIDHEDWFQAYLEALGLREDEAPLPVRLSHEHQYDILVDARIDAVVERVRAGAFPSQALNVRWRSRIGTRHYSYSDPSSRPVIEMTFQGTVSYRLLHFEGMVVQEEITGISGRPATGALSLLFRLFGQARAVWSRSAITADGWQVIVGKGRKSPFSRTATVTVRADGLAEQDVPADRPDLVALERRLRQPIRVVYRPWTRE